MAILNAHSIGSAAHSAEESEVNLPDDLVSEIIARLPIKTLARSKCVSKNWLSNISADFLGSTLPLLMSMICLPAEAAPRGPMDPRADGPLFACAPAGGRLLEECPLDFFPSHESAVVCDGSNGLLLCRAPGTPAFHVVSPLTRKWAALPPPRRDASLSMLAYDPFTSPHYHVINFTGWRDRGAAAEVFSSETWAWAERRLDFGVPAGSLSGTMHYSGGSAYIVASDCVVRVDVAGDSACNLIPLPGPADDDGHSDGRVAHSAGRLHYVCSDRDQLKLWVLDESPAVCGWRLKHAVRIDEFVEGGCGPGVEVRFLALDPEKDVVYIWSPWKIVQYDLTKGEIAAETWEFAKDARNRVVKTWMVPSSSYLSDCLPHGHKAA